MTQTTQTGIIISNPNSPTTENLDTWATLWAGFADFCVKVMSLDLPQYISHIFMEMHQQKKLLI